MAQAPVLIGPGGRCADWSPIGDRVMGGQSSSRVELRGDTLVFSGAVSLAQGGGFASIRCRAGALDLGACAGLALRAWGDARAYKLGLRTDAGFDGVQYQAPFAVSEAPAEIVLPWAQFEARYRGRRVPAPALDPAAVCSVGFVTEGRVPGEFRLVVERLRGL